MKVTMIPIVISALGTILNGLIKGLENLEIRRNVETTQKSVKILKRVLEARGDILPLKLQRKIISSRWCEKIASNI